MLAAFSCCVLVDCGGASSSAPPQALEIHHSATLNVLFADIAAPFNNALLAAPSSGLAPPAPQVAFSAARFTEPLSANEFNIINIPFAGLTPEHVGFAGRGPKELIVSQQKIDIFWDRPFQIETPATRIRIAGHACAHEVGHAILGTFHVSTVNVMNGKISNVIATLRAPTGVVLFTGDHISEIRDLLDYN